MVTARIIASQGLAMDLPKAASPTALQIVFSVELLADGRTRVDSNFVNNDDEVGARGKSALAKDKSLRAVIRADSSVPHGRVIHVLDLLKRAGIEKIAFAVTKIPEGVPVDTAPTKK
jgi:biopolymer transport protein ExbD